MRRALVLTTESARHPFRQRLPMAIFKVEAAPAPPPARAPMTDLAFFATSFVACFVIIMGLIL